MSKRGPKPSIVEFAGVGHAPTLLSGEQVDPVRAFLSAREAASSEAAVRAAKEP